MLPEHRTASRALLVAPRSVRRPTNPQIYGADGALLFIRLIVVLRLAPVARFMRWRKLHWCCTLSPTKLSISGCP